MTLEYAIVVATRNRLDMLTATLPLFVNQSRLAARIVIVDRSDDHESVVRLCESIAKDAPMPFDILYGNEPNLPSQRNQGLEYVFEPVVIFPDDDSFWYPDTAERWLAAYEADTNERYGAVSATDVYTLPGQPEAPVPVRRIRFTNLPVVMAVRNLIEAAAIPQPFNVYGLERMAALGPAAKADGLTYPLVASIGGYRMSFRTELAKRIQFDAVLGSKVGYGVHEDKDMGLRVLQAGALIAAVPDARVFHNVAPGKRANGFPYGFFHILNYLYICRKVFVDGSRPLGVTRRYLSYKVFLYGLRRSDAYDREVYRGARAALSEWDAIMTAQPEELAARYAEICARHH